MTEQKLILASASPRRKDLLVQIGLPPFAIVPADIDEAAQPKELPQETAQRLAREKARVVWDQIVLEDKAQSYVLAGDTLVACGRRELPKAETKEDAQYCLETLSGRRHKIYGGIAVIKPDGEMISRLVTTSVTFKRLSKEEIQTYIDSNEWQGKAGGYGIQGLAASYVKQINGSYTNIVGLSLYDTMNMLHGAGYKG